MAGCVVSRGGLLAWMHHLLQCGSGYFPPGHARGSICQGAGLQLPGDGVRDAGRIAGSGEQVPQLLGLQREIAGKVWGERRGDRLPHGKVLCDLAGRCRIQVCRSSVGEGKNVAAGHRHGYLLGRQVAQIGNTLHGCIQVMLLFPCQNDFDGLPGGSQDSAGFDEVSNTAVFGDASEIAHQNPVLG